MNEKQFDRMKNANGFIAALDQSGGSTPKALKAYGIDESRYANEDEMFDMVHEMRTRIMTNPEFNSEKILAAILFEQTMEREVEGRPTADYLWDVKGIVPILKIDKGLADEENSVQMMKPIPDLDEKLDYAVKERHIFGTKERSVIKDYNEEGIKNIVDQQFEIAETVAKHGMVPIIEPEVDIHSPNKQKCEEFMKGLILEKLAGLGDDVRVIFKLTLPSVPGFYQELIDDPHTVRVVALSGGYTQDEANEMLKQNHGVVASFSRALSQDLNADQSDAEFTATLKDAIARIFEASIA